LEYDAKYFVQTLAKGLSVLNTFKSDKDEFGILELSEFNHLPQSTVQRIVNTLEIKGYLIQNPISKKYRLSLKLLILENKIGTLKLWLDKTKQHMVNLNKKCGETVNLAIRSENSLIYLDKVDSSHMLRPNFIVGDRYPLHCTGLGRCLLSDLEEENINLLLKGTLEKLTPKTKTTLPEIREDLNQIRINGYFFDDEEFNLGLACIAAPIYAFGNKVIAAISVSMPKVRFNSEISTQLVEWTKETANIISEDYKHLFANEM
jgi:IclR family KDG regulon transcriptional repressor